MGECWGVEGVQLGFTGQRSVENRSSLPTLRTKEKKWGAALRVDDAEKNVRKEVSWTCFSRMEKYSTSPN
jgi:hypothetical protein